MINRVVLVGRLTRDVVVKKIQSGSSVATFSVACNRRFTGANGQEQQADFINCVAWRQTADFLGQYARKGALVSVEGRIQTRNYDNASGQKVYVTEVVCDTVQLLESRAASENRSPAMNYQPQEESFSADSGHNDSFDDFSAGPTLDISSDDLPF